MGVGIWNTGLYIYGRNLYIPVISSRAGGRKFQKKKETIGRSDALLIFCTTHARASLERHFSE